MASLNHPRTCRNIVRRMADRGKVMSKGEIVEQEK